MVILFFIYVWVDVLRSEYIMSDVSVCIGCHDSEMMEPRLRSIPAKWKKSWHYRNDVSCHDCHGGDPKDAMMSMLPERGFVGKPKYKNVPEFCGKCHIGILNNYLKGIHGRALKFYGVGPNCVICHGSHDIRKADIDIINEDLCTRCHSYERAKDMKQALSLSEEKIKSIGEDISKLKRAGVFTERLDKNLFSIHADFRILFHSVDISLVKQNANKFIIRLDKLDKQIKEINYELKFRKNFSAFLMFVFICIGVVMYTLSKNPGQDLK